MTEKISREAQQKEVDLNYKAFTELSQEFYEENHGKYALMRGGKVVNLFDTWDDAAKTGEMSYGEKAEPFSIQKVDNRTVSMGAYTYAVV